MRSENQNVPSGSRAQTHTTNTPPGGCLRYRALFRIFYALQSKTKRQKRNEKNEGKLTRGHLLFIHMYVGVLVEKQKKNMLN